MKRKQIFGVSCTLKNARKLFFNFKIRAIEILKNMPVKIWLTWKHQVMWTAICHIKLFPDNF